MKRIISALLLLIVTLSLFSCHRVISSIEFVVDGEVMETYNGSSRDVKFPTPKEKAGMVFYGWLTDEYLDDNLVTEDNVGEYFGFWPVLKLYAHYIVDEAQDNAPSDHEPEAPSEPEYEAPSDPEPEAPSGDPTNSNPNGNIDGGGWT